MKLNEIVKGDTIFCATGITSNEFKVELKGKMDFCYTNISYSQKSKYS